MAGKRKWAALLCICLILICSVAFSESEEETEYTVITDSGEQFVEVQVEAVDTNQTSETDPVQSAARKDFIDRIIALGKELYEKANGKAQRAHYKGDIYVCKNFTTYLFNQNKADFCMSEFPDVKLVIPNNLPAEKCKPYAYGFLWQDVSASKGNPFYVAAQFRYDSDLTAEENMDYTGNAEDSALRAVEQLKAHHLNRDDLVIGLAASGSTPYVVEGLRYAKETGAVTAAIACNEHSVIGQLADDKAEVLTGPEVLTGSTRLKAGTAEKMVLNMISTAAMVLNGKVMSNFMVDMKPSNTKLIKRAKSIVMEVTGCEEAEAEEAMRNADNHCKTAIGLIQQNQGRKGGDE